MDEIPHRSIKIVIVDMNAEVGSAITGTSTYSIYGLGNRNETGESLIEFCETNNLSWQILYLSILDVSTLEHHQTVQIETRLTI